MITAPNPETSNAPTASADGDDRQPPRPGGVPGESTFGVSAMFGIPLPRQAAGSVVGGRAQGVEVRGLRLVRLAGLQVAFQVQIDLVLQDFLHDDSHLVAAP